MTRLRFFLASMSGRIFLVLVSGLLLFSGLALVLGDMKRASDVRRFDVEMTAERAADFVGLLNSGVVDFDDLDKGIGQVAQRTHRDTWITPGIQIAGAHDLPLHPDMEMAALLQRRLGNEARDLVVHTTSPATCIPQQAQRDAAVQPQCWLVSLTLRDGRTLRMRLNTPLHLMIFATAPVLDPLYLTILTIGFAMVAFFVARMAAAPLDELSSAAKGLSDNIDNQPLVEHGPIEVRDAARAFNAMQDRLRQTLNERMQMLAAITHDLQTPLTRLRLRLEKVDNPELRGRLIADLGETLNLVTEGLELARFSSGPTESTVQLDLDSLLVSLVEDEKDAGRNVSLLHQAGCDVLARPQALRRCLANLIDNALKYAGAALVVAERHQAEVAIHVLDNGPGVPDHQLEQIFEPFFRVETSRSRETGGTGLGLTIARSLAQQNGGRLTVRNRQGGGLDVVLTLPVHRLTPTSPLHKSSLQDALPSSPTAAQQDEETFLTVS